MPSQTKVPSPLKFDIAEIIQGDEQVRGRLDSARSCLDVKCAAWPASKCRADIGVLCFYLPQSVLGVCSLELFIIVYCLYVASKALCEEISCN